MANTDSYIVLLKQNLISLEKEVCDFLSDVKVLKSENQDGTLVAISPRYRFESQLDFERKMVQQKLEIRFHEWEEHFLLLLKKVPENLIKEVVDITSFINKRIDLKTDWLIEDTIDKNILQVHKAFHFLNNIFEIISEKSGRFFLIPDAESLIASADLTRFISLVETQNVTIILLSVAIEKVSKIKNSSLDEDLRTRAGKIIDSIKELKRSGRLKLGELEGKGTLISILPSEPDMTQTLKWLDKSNPDDRVIGSALAIQHEYPHAVVTLVTSELNLQSKAELANLPFIEPEF